MALVLGIGVVVKKYLEGLGKAVEHDEIDALRHRHRRWPWT